LIRCVVTGDFLGALLVLLRIRKWIIC
jgi:hypothetical protein